MPRSERKIPLLPASLRARLTVTIVMASVLLFVLVYGVTTIATLSQARVLARQDAYRHLATIQRQITTDSKNLDSYIVGFADWQLFYNQTPSPDPSFIEMELDPWLRDRSDATIVVWGRPDGTTIFSYGSAADVAFIAHVATRTAAGLAAGPVALPSGPYLVAIRPVVGDPAGPSKGFLAIAKPISPDLLSTSDPALPQSATLLSQPSIDVTNWDGLDVPPGYSSASVKLEGSEVMVAAALSGIDGTPVGFIEMIDQDEWYASSTSAVRYAIPLGLGLLSLILGLALGLMLGKFIHRPIEEFVAYMRGQGYLAIEGLPFKETLDIDPALPDEFRELAFVIQDLLVQLRGRQAELKRANDQTVAAEHAFRTVVNDSSEVKLLVRAGLIDIANPAAAACLGIPLGLILQQPAADLLGKMNMQLEDGEPVTADSLFETALDQPTLVRCDSPTHAERWMKVTVSESTSPDAFLLTARNVTEEHRLEALRTEIVSLVSHDLRAPLTVVAGYLELLASPLPDEARAKASEAALKAARRMSTLLGELLETTRAEQVFAPTTFKKVRLGILADEVAEAVRMSSERRVVVTKHRMAPVLGDELRLRQAIENLVGNAIKHTPEDTDVIITIDATDERGILTVEDFGPGVPEDQREAIFERFTQLNRVSGNAGLGLGLYIVRTIAESHGGSVRVEAADSGGAKFVLEIPMAPSLKRVEGDEPQDSDELSA
jgi:signal transduction histidine kinase